MSICIRFTVRWVFLDLVSSPKSPTQLYGRLVIRLSKSCLVIRRIRLYGANGTNCSPGFTGEGKTEWVSGKMTLMLQYPPD